MKFIMFNMIMLKKLVINLKRGVKERKKKLELIKNMNDRERLMKQEDCKRWHVNKLKKKLGLELSKNV